MIMVDSSLYKRGYDCAVKWGSSLIRRFGDDGRSQVKDLCSVYMSVSHGFNLDSGEYSLSLGSADGFADVLNGVCVLV